ncbi:MAG TPA: hypothetical protein VF902_09860, partial [Coriobacteriia bacterium]
MSPHRVRIMSFLAIAGALSLVLFAPGAALAAVTDNAATLEVLAQSYTMNGLHAYTASVHLGGGSGGVVVGASRSLTLEAPVITIDAGS